MTAPGKILVAVSCLPCGTEHQLECLPIPTHPGLAIAPPTACGAIGYVYRWSIAHIRSGSGVLDLEGPDQAPMAVDFLDAELGPIDWTASAEDIHAAVPGGGRGLARRWATHAGIRYVYGRPVSGEAATR